MTWCNLKSQGHGFGVIWMDLLCVEFFRGILSISPMIHDDKSDRQNTIALLSMCKLQTSLQGELSFWDKWLLQNNVTYSQNSTTRIRWDYTINLSFKGALSFKIKDVTVIQLEANHTSSLPAYLSFWLPKWNSMKIFVRYFLCMFFSWYLCFPYQLFFMSEKFCYESLMPKINPNILFLMFTAIFIYHNIFHSVDNEVSKPETITVNDENFVF